MSGKRWLMLVLFLEAMSITMGCQAKRVKTFGEDVAFLKQHAEVIVLEDATGQAKAAVVPDYQGRVMTSTASGCKGDSFGWLNYDLIQKGLTQKHINPSGGEDRFWLGPEGGQFSIFFKGPDPFDFDHWQTPALIDTDKFDVIRKSKNQVQFCKQAQLTNYSGAEFQFTIDRSIRLLDRAKSQELLGVKVPEELAMVTFESDNKITNAGSEPWTKETGMLSIWILGMFKHSPQTTIVVPFIGGPEDQLGPKVNDAYFGKVPADRLIVKEDVLFFRGDGQYRSKIGLSPLRAKPVCGSYDESRNILTLVQYTKPEGAMGYVNSMWEFQKDPFAGDVVNSYNDGPPTPGAKPLGPFYELETSSPAAALAPGASLSHVHRTYHIQGEESELDRIAKAVLGVELREIKNAF